MTRIGSLFTLLVLASFAHGSLAPINVSQGGRSITFTDPLAEAINTTPYTIVSGDATWAPFFTSHSMFNGGANATSITLEIDDNGTLYTMQKVTSFYDFSGNRLILTDFDTNAEDGTQRVRLDIFNVNAPNPITGSTKLDDVMITGASSYQFTEFDGSFDVINQFTISAIPEPSAFILCGLLTGLVGVRFVFRRKKK